MVFQFLLQFIRVGRLVWCRSNVYRPNSCPLLSGAMRGRLLRCVCAPAASGGQRRAGGLPTGGASGAAGRQGETAAGLRSVSGSAPGPQGPHAAHHAKGWWETETLSWRHSNLCFVDLTKIIVPVFWVFLQNFLVYMFFLLVVLLLNYSDSAKDTHSLRLRTQLQQALHTPEYRTISRCSHSGVVVLKCNLL